MTDDTPRPLPRPLPETERGDSAGGKNFSSLPFQGRGAGGVRSGLKDKSDILQSL